MSQLDESTRNEIIRLLKENHQLPLDLKEKLCEVRTPKEIAIVYRGKEREEDILADTMSVPLQKVKTFRQDSDEWSNKLIFGDNLQALKTLLKDPKVSGKVKLIYIDPPFGTGDIYDAIRGTTPAYSAKLQGAEFVEFLRKRLVLLRKLLAPDGSIYIRLDYHYGHYIKCIMDELFDKQNFEDEIIINRSKRMLYGLKKFNVSTDSLLFYTNSQRYVFNEIHKNRICSLCKRPREPTWGPMHSPGLRHPPERTVMGKFFLPPRDRHWTFQQSKIDKMTLENRIRINHEVKFIDIKGNEVKGMPEFLQTEETVADSNWTDITGYSRGYPTQNPVELLERVIEASSNPGDIVMDCFAGSGTTGIAAEHKDRRWIMCDISKLAIYTILGRLLTMKQSGKKVKPKPFGLYNAGLYDFDIVSKLGEIEYRQFALELFQAEPRKTIIGGFEFEGMLYGCPVHVYLGEGKLNEKYVNFLHKFVGAKTDRVFIIAPAGKVELLQDYIYHDGTKYYFLRIPYSIINEIHKTKFTRPLQPISKANINDPVESVGFDFVIPPEVECEYYSLKDSEKLTEELVIQVKRFEPIQITRTPIDFKDKEALSMIMIDRHYNEEFFNITDYFFRDEIENKEFMIKIPSEDVGEKMMIIYLDVLGNEKREVLTANDFKKRVN